MAKPVALQVFCVVLASLASAQVPLAPPIENPTHQYVQWGDYKIEVNQYGGLGRNWPSPDLIWQQYDLLKKKAEANPEPPNTLRTLLLVIPNTEAVAVKRDGDEETIVGRKSTSMTSAEIRSALMQWRQFEDMVFVYSGGNAWLRTDVKFIDEPLHVKTDENWEFWSGQQRELLDKYLPFERGDYQSYNAIYNSKGLRASPHGGTIGSVAGIRGCGTSDTAYYGPARRANRTGYVALHEWLNQQCSATSNMMPYPDGETLWNNYVLQKMGYREDTELDDWPWLTMRRDTMTQVIRPGMWRRWTAIDPYRSPAIDRWVLFGPQDAGAARELSTAPASDGRLVEMEMGRYTPFNMMNIRGPDGREWGAGTHYFRTFVTSDRSQEVRLWAGADERFKLWLNGVMVRDGWGWNYDEDDGNLVEKVTYVTLERGVNTLVLELPNDNHKVEFRVRFCRTDGSGLQPEGVSTSPSPGDATPVPLADPVVHDFTHPQFYTWDDIQDQPWLKLPRLGEKELRTLTGIDQLSVVTKGPLYDDPRGQRYQPPQHVLLDVPQDAVTSPWIGEPIENTARLNNDLDTNWEAVGWLRVPGRPGPEKDIILLRVDVAEPLLHLLKTKGRLASESIVGWYLFEHKLGYVVLTNLDIERAPETELGLLSQQPR